MNFTVKFDKTIVGFLTGLIFPLLVGITIFLFSPSHLSLQSYLERIVETHIITHSITLCVFPNVFIFLIYNRLDMLKATRGVLAMTIVWAVIVFGVKLFA
jgi:hypothetical protein